ncbi:hypothetical protein KNP414_06956 [Paenibacillus mucilaginosus KNP414]|uniref:Uncharacterized protein n=1 Tax=Paenibacillus mucilaginosus (strain KNP414) TaxID=1036673 RepID=F8FIL4_PAEMK|nr:hypothetical protein KNP414_06956 [Paenibacillus mucilaginosus KNP414]
MYLLPAAGIGMHSAGSYSQNTRWAQVRNEEVVQTLYS